MSVTVSLRYATGAMVILFLGPSLPMMMPEPGRASAHSRQGKDPFPRQIKIIAKVELDADETRIDRVTFTATKREPCLAGGQCDYTMDPREAMVSLSYRDSFGCQGTASAPPFSHTMATVGFGLRGENGSYPFSFSVRLDYSTVHYRCDDGTSGSDGANSSSASSTENISWRPGQRASRTVLVDNFLGARGFADIYYRY